MVTDERLNEIQNCFIEFFAIAGERKSPRLTDDEIYSMATKLLSLRSQKARLISELTKYRDGEESILQSCPSIYGEGAKFAYNTVLKLLKELEETNG